MHHLRNDLTPRQLAHIINVFTRLIHNPCLSNNVHTLAAKMLFNLVETVAVKETPQEAARILTNLLETCVDKLDSVLGVLEEVNARLERSKKGTPETGKIYLVEKARPVGAASYAVEKPEDVLAGEPRDSSIPVCMITTNLSQNRGFYFARSCTASGLAFRAYERSTPLFPMEL